MPNILIAIFQFFLSLLVKFLLWLLAALTGTGAAVLLGAPDRPDPPAAPQGISQELTIMSFNVWGFEATGARGIAKRRGGVLQTIRGEMPDSFGLQEANELWKLILRWRLRGEYGIACHKGRVFGLDEAVPVFYRKDKYKLVDEGVFWLSETPCKTSIGWDNGGDAGGWPRVAGYAVLRDKRTGFTYVHFNSHFDNAGEIARANSARLIADRLNAMGLAAVFTADINAGPGSLPVQYLTAGGLIDLRVEAEITDTGRTFHAYGGGGMVIDYIFANQCLTDAAEFKVIRDEYDGLYPSDHFAVAATFTLEN